MNLKKSTILLLAMVFFFACSEKYQGDNEYLNSNTEVFATFDEEALVSLELSTRLVYSRQCKS